MENKREEVEAVLFSHLCQIMAEEYARPVFEVIKDDVYEDIDVCADDEGWSNGDLHLAIGRILCKKLECEI